jgi:hypothetical protein
MWCVHEVTVLFKCVCDERVWFVCSCMCVMLMLECVNCKSAKLGAYISVAAARRWHLYNRWLGISFSSSILFHTGFLTCNSKAPV